MNTPYKVFFPIGLITAISGILPFVLNFFSAKKIYPIDFHFSMMIEIFFNLIIAGFALTALPQFTKTDFLNKKEIMAIAILFIAAQFSLVFEYIFIFHSLLLAYFIFAFSFSMIKLITARENPPSSFYLLPLGFLIGIFAEILLLINTLLQTIDLIQIAKSMLYFGYYPLLIMGVGLRLIPGLLGHNDIVQRQKAHYDNHRTIPSSIYWIAIAWFISFIFFMVGQNTIGTIILILWFLTLGYTHFRIYKKPTHFTPHTLGIWISLWMMPIALIIKLVYPNESQHWLHLFFINGLLQLILMILFRVTVAHNKLGFELEKSKVIYVLIGLLQFAGITRASAHYLPNSYLNHLGYAAILLIIVYIMIAHKLKYFQEIKKT